MKTLKLIVIAVLMSFSAVVMATGTDKPTQGNSLEIKPEAKKAVRMHLLHAIKVPGLVEQMYLQIDESSFIENPTENLLIAKVVHNNTNYFIFGTVQEWIAFFGLEN